jgi:protein-L-isoaspartate O-methyltransferase
MIELIFYLILLGICFLFLYQMTRGAIFVPSHKRTVEIMVKLAEVQPGMKVADLGSGDGRIVIAMALRGAEVIGFELNPILAYYSRWKIKNLGLTSKAKIVIGDFWNADLSQFDVVTLFGIDYIMEKLGEKLQKEMKNGSTVISNAFEFKAWKKEKSESGINVYRINR